MKSFPTLNYEQSVWDKGIDFVCGIDEVGRGSWAGPVVAAAVVFPKTIINDVITNKTLQQITDSKMLSPQAREELSPVIKKYAAAFSIAEVRVEMINKHGIGKCTQYAYRKAIKGLNIKPEFILIDAFYVKYLPKKAQLPVIRGDSQIFSIAAASIIAKVYRDNLMCKLHNKYPVYEFDKHKGYGTKLHQQHILNNGLCEIHRTSFNLNLSFKQESE